MLAAELADVRPAFAAPRSFVFGIHAASSDYRNINLYKRKRKGEGTLMHNLGFYSSGTGGGAAGPAPSAWPVVSAQRRNWAPPSGNRHQDPISRGIARGSCCIGCGGGA